MQNQNAWYNLLSVVWHLLKSFINFFYVWLRWKRASVVAIISCELQNSVLLDLHSYLKFVPPMRCRFALLLLYYILVRFCGIITWKRLSLRSKRKVIFLMCVTMHPWNTLLKNKHAHRTIKNNFCYIELTVATKVAEYFSQSHCHTLHPSTVSSGITILTTFLLPVTARRF